MNTQRNLANTPAPELETHLAHALAAHDEMRVLEVMTELTLRANAKWRESALPYPWCSQPSICQHRGSCPRDPNCGE